jgi:DHA2 family multidrug resistance protein-like MFS transporter
MSPFTASLWSLSVMPAITVAMTVAGIAAKKVRPAYVIGTGLLISAAGLTVMTQTHVHQSLVVVLVGSGLLAAGMLVATTLTADMILTAAPPERAGAASAVSETGSELGGALGFALLGSVGTAVYHHQMAGVAPAGISPQAQHAAQDTLGSAAAVAAQLPGQAGSALLETAREAFTQGMNLTGLTGAVVLLVTAVAATVYLRQIPVATPANAPATGSADAQADAQADADPTGDTGRAVTA